MPKQAMEYFMKIIKMPIMKYVYAVNKNIIAEVNISFFNFRKIFTSYH